MNNTNIYNPVLYKVWNTNTHYVWCIRVVDKEGNTLYRTSDYLSENSMPVEMVDDLMDAYKTAKMFVDTHNVDASIVIYNKVFAPDMTDKYHEGKVLS